MSPFWQQVLFRAVGVLARPLLACYYMTVRIVDEPGMQSALNRHPRLAGVYAFWHAHQLSAVWHFRRSGAAILISASRDGEYIARLARSMGYTPVRGSSSRMGAAGLKGMIDQACRGCPVAITPDGPRGPRHSVNPGVLLLAQKSGLPIVPLAVGLSRFWELPSWDRFRIPKPFSKGYACWGQPLCVSPSANQSELDALAEELRRRMVELEERADRIARTI